MVGMPAVYENLVSDILTYKKKGSRYSFPSYSVRLEMLPSSTLSVYSCLLPCSHDGADFRLKLCVHVI